MIKKIFLLLPVALMLSSVACNRKGNVTTDANKGPVGACHYVKDNYCNEYYGNMVTKQWIDDNNCKPLNTTVIDKCPTEKALKRCVFDGGTAQERHLLTYHESAAFYCKQPGVVEKAP